MHDLALILELFLDILQKPPHHKQNDFVLEFPVFDFELGLRLLDLLYDVFHPPLIH